LVHLKTDSLVFYLII